MSASQTPTAARAGHPSISLSIPSADDRIHPDSRLASPAAAILREVQLAVTVELGRATLSPQQARDLEAGSVIPLDALADEPVRLYVNDRLIARGQLVMLDGRLSVRITDIVSNPQDPTP